MRVNGSISVAWEVFGSRDRARTLGTFSERSGESTDFHRILTIRANIDHGIRGVIVNVDNRREDVLNPEGSRFPARYLTLPPCIVRVTGRTYGHASDPGRQVHRRVAGRGCCRTAELSARRALLAEDGGGQRRARFLPASVIG